MADIEAAFIPRRVMCLWCGAAGGAALYWATREPLRCHPDEARVAIANDLYRVNLRVGPRYPYHRWVPVDEYPVLDPDADHLRALLDELGEQPYVG